MDVISLPDSDYQRLDYLQRCRLYLNQCQQKGVVPKGSHATASTSTARGDRDSDIRKIKEVVRDQQDQIKRLEEAWNSDNDDLFSESKEDSPKESNRNNRALVRYAEGTKPGSVRQTASKKRKK